MATVDILSPSSLRLLHNAKSFLALGDERGAQLAHLAPLSLLTSQIRGLFAFMAPPRRVAHIILKSVGYDVWSVLRGGDSANG